MLDLVVVLDVSDSMGDFGKLDKLKSAMRFVSAMDRLSTVTFNGGATRQCPMRAMSKDTVPILTDICPVLMLKNQLICSERKTSYHS